MESYRVNLRRKAGSQLDRDIWSSLEARIVGQKPADQSQNDPK
jgi:hypothetical protein